AGRRHYCCGDRNGHALKTLSKTEETMARTYHGSCHCGAVSYEADVDLNAGTTKCNCTFCMKARAWKAFVRPEAFRLSSGADQTTSYHKHPQAPLKHFCPICGV